MPWLPSSGRLDEVEELIPAVHVITSETALDRDWRRSGTAVEVAARVGGGDGFDHRGAACGHAIGLLHQPCAEAIL